MLHKIDCDLIEINSLEFPNDGTYHPLRFICYMSTKKRKLKKPEKNSLEKILNMKYYHPLIFFVLPFSLPFFF